MKQKRYHVIVSGTEFFLDVEQIGGTQDVPMIGRQENNISWNRYGREHINPSQKNSIIINKNIYAIKR